MKGHRGPNMRAHGKRSTVLAISAATLMLIGYLGSVQGARAVQQEQSSKAPGQPRQDYLEPPLPASDRPYGAIDGKHMWQYVKEQAAIAERYRDHGHSQFWGRI